MGKNVWLAFRGQEMVIAAGTRQADVVLRPGVAGRCQRGRVELAAILAGTASVHPSTLDRAKVLHAGPVGPFLSALDATQARTQSHWLARTTHLVRAIGDVGLVCGDDLPLQRRPQWSERHPFAERPAKIHGLAADWCDGRERGGQLSTRTGNRSDGIAAGFAVERGSNHRWAAARLVEPVFSSARPPAGSLDVFGGIVSGAGKGFENDSILLQRISNPAGDRSLLFAATTQLHQCLSVHNLSGAGGSLRSQGGLELVHVGFSGHWKWRLSLFLHLLF